MKLANIVTVFKKEIRNYYDSPAAYVVLIVFLVLWQFLFFRNVFLVGETSLRILLSYIPWLFIIFVPAVTMGSVSAEKSDGTIEFVLTHPLKVLEWLLGKFFASTLFIISGLIFIFPVGLGLSLFGQLDWGVVLGQFIASTLLAASLVSLGLFVSSVFSSQIASLLVASATTFGLVILGFELITLSLPPKLAAIFERISVLSRFESMSRGVIDLRDVLYFGSFIAVFISLSYLQITKLRFGNQKPIFRNLSTSVLLLVAIAIMINIVGSRIPGRLDLTANQIYQLSPVTKEVLVELDDVVNIKLFASSDLPAQLRPVLREAKDLLRDYQLFGSGKIQVTTIDPGSDESAANEANSIGIQPVQFNVVDQDALSLKRGYFGLAVQYAGESEIIPILSDTSDLEYQLTRNIKKLTTSDKKSIVFVTTEGSKSMAEFSVLTKELAGQFEVTEQTITEEEELDLPESSLYVLAGNAQVFPENLKDTLISKVNEGSSLLFLKDSIAVNQMTLTAEATESQAQEVLAEYGVTVNSDLVYDLRSNETVSFSNASGVGYLVQYPFWPRALVADPESALGRQVKDVVLPWPSSISLDQNKIDSQGFTATVLLTTSPYASKQVRTFNIQPDNQLVGSDVEQFDMAVTLQHKNTDESNSGRIGVVGDSDFLSDSFVSQSPENLAFGLELVSSLTQEKSLADIKVKQRVGSNLVFSSTNQPGLIKYGNLGLAILLPAVIGATRIISRQQLRKQKYHIS